jgi:RNA polymerase sigma factor (sigma-70 family)
MGQVEYRPEDERELIERFHSAKWKANAGLFVSKEEEQAQELVMRWCLAFSLKWLQRKGEQYADVEDIAVEFTIRAHRDVEQWRGGGPFQHWAIVVLKHTYLDWLRREKRWRGIASLEQELAEEEGEGKGFFMADLIHARGFCPEQTRFWEEIVEIIRSVLKKETVRDRLIFLGCYMGKKTHQLAEEWGISQGRVSQVISKIRREIREAIEIQGYTEEDLRALAEKGFSPSLPIVTEELLEV